MEDSLKERVDDHEERIRDLEIKGSRNDLLTETCVKALDKLDVTMNNVSITMAKLTEKVDGSEKAQKETNRRIGELSKKIDEIEDRGKFDFSQWTKDNFIKVIIFVILACLAFPQISEIIKSVF